MVITKRSSTVSEKRLYKNVHRGGVKRWCTRSRDEKMAIGRKLLKERQVD